MGLFSFVGKIAKAGLSAVTHGLSDKVLSFTKAALGGKPKAAAVVKNAAPPTVKDKAMLNKAIEGYGAPRVIQRPAEGWSFGKAKASGNGKARPRRRATSTKLTRWGNMASVTDEDLLNNIAYGADGKPLRSESLLVAEARRRGLTVRGTKRAKKQRRSPAKPRTGRKAPSGGLDLKKIAQMWRAEGKPGVWKDYIKAHSNVRKP